MPRLDLDFLAFAAELEVDFLFFELFAESPDFGAIEYRVVQDKVGIDEFEFGSELPKVELYSWIAGLPQLVLPQPACDFFSTFLF